MKKLDIVRPRCRSLKSKILRGKLSLFDLFGACSTLDSPQFWDWESLRWVRVWKLIDQFIGHVFIFHIIRPLSFLLLHRLILLSGHSDFAIWVSSNHQTWRLEITWSHHQKRDIHRLTMVDSSNSLGHRDRAPMFKPFLGFPVGIPNPWVSINTQHVRWLKHVYELTHNFHDILKASFVCGWPILCGFLDESPHFKVRRLLLEALQISAAQISHMGCSTFTSRDWLQAIVFQWVASSHAGVIIQMVIVI